MQMLHKTSIRLDKSKGSFPATWSRVTRPPIGRSLWGKNASLIMHLRGLLHCTRTRAHFDESHDGDAESPSKDSVIRHKCTTRDWDAPARGPA